MGTMAENESADAPRPRVQVASMVIGGFLVFEGWALSLVVPSFRKVFEDLGKELGTLSRWVVYGPVWLWPLLGAGFCALLCLKDLRVRKGVAVYLDIAGVVLVCAVGILAVMALLAPLVGGVIRGKSD